ncbi:MAG: hypothetical protein AAF621_03735 [Pseudomonadota bacterium]
MKISPSPISPKTVGQPIGKPPNLRVVSLSLSQKTDDEDAKSICSVRSDYKTINRKRRKNPKPFHSKKPIGKGTNGDRAVYKLWGGRRVIKRFIRATTRKKDESKKNAIQREIRIELIAHAWAKRALGPDRVPKYIRKGDNFIVYERGGESVSSLLKNHLRDVCKSRREELILRLIREYLEIVIMLNEKGLCHNDLHLGNVLLADKDLTVIDYELMQKIRNGEFVKYSSCDNETLRNNHPANIVLTMIKEAILDLPTDVKRKEKNAICKIETVMEEIFEREKALGPLKHEEVVFPEGHHKKTYDAIKQLLNDRTIWQDAMSDDELRNLSKEIRCRNMLSGLEEKLKSLTKKFAKKLRSLTEYGDTENSYKQLYDRHYNNLRLNMRESKKAQNLSEKEASLKKLTDEYYSLRKCYDKLKKHYKLLMRDLKKIEKEPLALSHQPLLKLASSDQTFVSLSSLTEPTQPTIDDYDDDFNWE